MFGWGLSLCLFLNLLVKTVIWAHVHVSSYKKIKIDWVVGSFDAVWAFQLRVSRMYLTLQLVKW